MKKISINGREVSAAEYPVRFFPKTPGVKATVNGAETEIRFTSGKGKSAIDNHYVYFIEGEKMFYARTNPVEVAALKAEVGTIADVVEGAAPVAETPVEEPVAPKAKRVRAKA